MDQPVFTIIMPNYNMGQFISDSITSILAQTFENFELLIIDNCSTDNSWEEISKFTDSRVSKYRQVSNLGM
jgi:glycosyltransferase involved in cell wall biosynthesis